MTDFTKIDKILSEGNESFGGEDIRKRLAEAGYQIVPNDGHELNRIIVGNQIFIMRALMAREPVHLGGIGQPTIHTSTHGALSVRVHDIKSWWRERFDEEVGFSTQMGDESPKSK